MAEKKRERGAAYAVPEVGGTKAGAVEVVGMRVPEGATSGREVLPKARVVDLGEVGQTTWCSANDDGFGGKQRGMGNVLDRSQNKGSTKNLV